MATRENDNVEVKSKRPSDSAFKQQRLPAWQPILTAGTVFPAFFIIGLAFIPIGIGLLISSDRVREQEVNYTNCTNANNQSCADLIGNNTDLSCQCDITFKLDHNFEAPVYLYYGLTNYYQNHRRYVKSRDDQQLAGGVDKVSKDCQPFTTVGNKTVEKKYAPCGAIANSFFNDTLSLKYHTNTGEMVPIVLIDVGIAWPTDKKVKFKNPPGNVTTGEAFKDTVPPPNWKKPVWKLSTNPSNNGYENEDLIVWMRTAALPKFRKLYRKIDHQAAPFTRGLPNGTYTLHVDYNYPVTLFKGTKRMILSNTSWLGGRNRFLGIAYIVVGIICLLLAIFLLIMHNKFAKSAQDLMNITQSTSY